MPNSAFVGFQSASVQITSKHETASVIWGFRRSVNKILAPLRCYSAHTSVIDVSEQRMGLIFKGEAAKELPLIMGRICCFETSINIYQFTLHNIPEERRSHDIFSLMPVLFYDK